MANTQASESRRELNAVYEVSKTLATSLDVGKTFREALNYLLQAFDWRRAFVVTSEAEGKLRGLCSVGLTPDERERLQFRSGEGIVGRVYLCLGGAARRQGCCSWHGVGRYLKQAGAVQVVVFVVYAA